MKIGFVLDDTLDTADGVQQYVLTIGAWLSAQGHSVHYLVGQTERTDIATISVLSRNVKVRFNGNRMSMPLPASRSKIRRLLATEQFDVLHVQLPCSPFMAGRVVAAAPAQTAVVGTFHIAPNSWVVTAANRVLGLMLRRTLGRFQRIVSVSTAAAAFARQTYGIATDVIPNAVVVQRFAAAKPYDAYRGTPTIMFLGRLVPRKGCQVFLSALAALKADAAVNDFRALVVGRGPLEAELKEYVRQYGLDEQVEFTGFVSEENKMRYLKSADIAVFPSSGGESFGIVLIEAMAAGRPIVLGAGNPGYHAVLEPCPDALFPVGDSAHLADQLRHLLASPASLQKRLAWQQDYVQQFDVGAVGPRLTQLYAAACASLERSKTS